MIQVPGDFSTIQAALHAAAPGDKIEVAPGTYNEVIQFQKKAVTLRSAGGPAVTTIDGTGFNESVVRSISGEGPDTVLQGFTITGGIATFGGGMRNAGSSPTVIDCIFTANSASERGGGMHNLMANPTVVDSEFFDNFATEMGGGMYNEISSPTVSGCIFRENSANKGAGMRNYIDADPTITDSVFIHNSASEDGGGMGNRKNSKPTVTRCKFIGNTAGMSGGGIHNYVGNAIETGVPMVSSSLFVGNSASEGGAMRNGDVSPVVTNCTFVGNNGSGMYNRSGATPTVTNSIFWGNLGGSFTGQGLETVSFSVVEGGHAGTGNIDVDPLFVDFAGPDGNPSTP
ncbi:MAG: right-handed parallel beta-helix repeat-containing protein, partial [Planctomycetota bacterium]